MSPFPYMIPYYVKGIISYSLNLYSFNSSGVKSFYKGSSTSNSKLTGNLFVNQKLINQIISKGIHI